MLCTSEVFQRTQRLKMQSEGVHGLLLGRCLLLAAEKHLRSLSPSAQVTATSIALMLTQILYPDWMRDWLAWLKTANWLLLVNPAGTAGYGLMFDMWWAPVPNPVRHFSHALPFYQSPKVLWSFDHLPVLTLNLPVDFVFQCFRTKQKSLVGRSSHRH
jgi:hypothetical protein